MTLVFASEELRVDPEKEPPDDLEEVQSTMQSARCLDVETYPAIRFRSTRVTGPDAPAGDTPVSSGSKVKVSLFSLSRLRISARTIL